MANTNLEALTDSELFARMDDLIADGDVPGTWREVEALRAEITRREEETPEEKIAAMSDAEIYAAYVEASSEFEKDPSDDDLRDDVIRLGDAHSDRISAKRARCLHVGADPNTFCRDCGSVRVSERS